MLTTLHTILFNRPLYCSTINDTYISRYDHYSNGGFVIHAEEIGRETLTGRTVVIR